MEKTNVLSFHGLRRARKPIIGSLLRTREPIRGAPRLLGGTRRDVGLDTNLWRPQRIDGRGSRGGLEGV
eukprot:1176208-Prorocentrum_minimum.AAC.4